MTKSNYFQCMEILLKNSHIESLKLLLDSKELFITKNTNLIIRDFIQYLLEENISIQYLESLFDIIHPTDLDILSLTQDTKYIQLFIEKGYKIKVTSIINILSNDHLPSEKTKYFLNQLSVEDIVESKILFDPYCVHKSRFIKWLISKNFNINTISDSMLPSCNSKAIKILLDNGYKLYTPERLFDSEYNVIDKLYHCKYADYVLCKLYKEMNDESKKERKSMIIKYCNDSSLIELFGLIEYQKIKLDKIFSKKRIDTRQFVRFIEEEFPLEEEVISPSTISMTKVISHQFDFWKSCWSRENKHITDSLERIVSSGTTYHIMDRITSTQIWLSLYPREFFPEMEDIASIYLKFKRPRMDTIKKWRTKFFSPKFNMIFFDGIKRDSLTLLCLEKIYKECPVSYETRLPDQLQEALQRYYDTK